jgi:hypothetical protein
MNHDYCTHEVMSDNGRACVDCGGRYATDPDVQPPCARAESIGSADTLPDCTGRVEDGAERKRATMREKVMGAIGGAMLSPRVGALLMVTSLLWGVES